MIKGRARPPPVAIEKSRARAEPPRVMAASPSKDARDIAARQTLDSRPVRLDLYSTLVARRR